MALDDADHRALQDLERQLEKDSPRLARTLRAERPGHSLQALPVLGGILALLSAFGWLSVQAGSVLPLLLALPPAALAGLLLVWQRTDSTPARAGHRESEVPADRHLHDGPPPWWIT